MNSAICYDNNSIEIQHLLKVDPVLADLIQNIEKREIELSTNYFVSLIDSIIGQQLSNRVAEILSERFWGLFQSTPSPRDVIDLDAKLVRACGIAEFKILYIKNLATAIENGTIVFDSFENLSDSEICAALTSIKGIGPWTSEMFLLFSMGRKDVFSKSDAGLKRAICVLYKLDKDNYLSLVDNIIQKWHPYQSIASLYLWAGLDKGIIK